MSNSTQWHKHKDGTWHKTTVVLYKPSEFRYEQLGTLYTTRFCPVIGPIETLEAVHSEPTSHEVDS